MDGKKIIKNAIWTAKRDGYDQVVYQDGDGLFWFQRDYPGRIVFPDEKIVGHVRVGWTAGILSARYVPA